MDLEYFALIVEILADIDPDVIEKIVKQNI